MIRAFAALVIIGLTGAAAYYLYAVSGQKKGPGSEQAAPPVIVEPLMRRELVDQIDAIGSTFAMERVTLTAPVTDPVVAITFEDGQKVKKGDVLVSLDTRVAAAQLNSAKATLTEAQQQLDRIQSLSKTGAATETRRDEQQRLRDTAKAEVERMAAEIDRRLLRAPFDGIVGLRRVSVGALVQPGTELATLQDVSQLKLDFTVPELYLGSLKPGQEILAKSPVYPSREFKGAISAIEATVDPISRAVTVRAIIPNAEGALAPGMLLTVGVIRERATPLMAPEAAVISLGDQRFMFRVEGDVVRRVVVKTGRRKPGYIEIIDGLKENEVIIVDGVIRARDGGKVRPQPRAANGGNA